MIDTGQTNASYLLDTDVVSYIFGSRPEAARYEDLIRESLAAICFVTLAEMLRGAITKGWSRHRMNELEQYLAGRFVFLPYHASVSQEWATLVSACHVAGLGITENDAWIAASAVVFRAALVSNDRIFRRVREVYPALVIAT